MDRDELAFALSEPAPLRIVRTPRRLEEGDASLAARTLKNSKNEVRLKVSNEDGESRSDGACTVIYTGKPPKRGGSSSKL